MIIKKGKGVKMCLKLEEMQEDCDPRGGNWEREMKKRSLSGKSGVLAGTTVGRITNPPSTAAHKSLNKMCSTFSLSLIMRLNCIRGYVSSFAINRNINTYNVVLTVDSWAVKKKKDPGDTEAQSLHADMRAGLTHRRAGNDRVFITDRVHITVQWSRIQGGR